jgi:hypothetical protein
MKTAMDTVLIPAEREIHIGRGLIQAKKFSWETFGKVAAETFSLAAGRAPRVPALEIADVAVQSGYEWMRTLVRTTKRRVRKAK